MSAPVQKTRISELELHCGVQTNQGMNVQYDRAYFETRVAPDLNSGCWLWAGCLNQDGYGRVGMKRAGRVKMVAAHRLSYEAFHGPIDAGLWVLHKCDTPTCVNPNHLFLGDVKDNMADCSRKGRTRFQRFGQRQHCRRGHEFTPDNTRIMRDGARRCRTCIAIWRLEYIASKRTPLSPRAKPSPEVDAVARSLFEQRWPSADWSARWTNRTWWRRKAQALIAKAEDHPAPEGEGA